VMLPTETDVPLPVLDINVDENTQTDTLNVYNDGSLSADVGVHGLASDDALLGLEELYEAPGTLSVNEFGTIAGLQMGEGLDPLVLNFGTLEEPIERTFFRGITYHGLEVANIHLGQNDDTFTVEATVVTPMLDGEGLPTGEVSGTITVVQGGGGSDTITVSGGGGSIAPLIVFGDTSQDGTFYNSTTESVTDYLNGDSTVVPLGRQFNNPGDDVIDASASTLGVTIYGGAGDDTIIGSQVGDHLAGGSGDDTIHGEGGDDHIYGDAGFNVNLSKRVEQANLGNQQILLVTNNDASSEPTRDTLAPGHDVLRGGDGNDIVIGDFGVIAQTFFTQRLLTTGAVTSIESVNTESGGDDTLYGDDGEDILIGGANTIIDGVRQGDRVDGGAGKDLVFGDNVRLDRTAIGADDTNPRFRALQGAQLYGQGIAVNGSASGEVLVTTAEQLDPTGTPVWEDFGVTLLLHSFADEAAGLTNFGNDYLAGGAGDDQIFGHLGDDVIQGDGSIDLVVGAVRNEGTGLLELQPSVDDYAGVGTDGDDYIEGNGGEDVIFGNLGQDDIVGGSSSLFSLPARTQRPDGSDLIFGGSGSNAARNDDGLAGADAHGRDADMILGDNGNIYRIVNVDTEGAATFASFTYDDIYGEQIVVRAAELLDYTPGGSDYDADGAALDIGGADEIHGESGDDFISGMKGNDVLFGDGQDDDLIGGYGHDWISGGTGQDGVIGDDGRIFTSRNGLAEPLNGIAAIPAGELDQTITTPGNMQTAVINVGGALKKAVDLAPYYVEEDEYELSPSNHADDVIYGGWDDDFLHGGVGDDAISGAEAAQEQFDQPANTGNMLGYDPATGEFAAYDEYDPWSKIGGFFLNTAASDGRSLGDGFHSDGNDAVFGGLGNDWLVGGTGRDNLYGGWGDDLLNADDDLDTNGGTNTGTDTHATYEDRAYGGAGRDILIGNTGGDRLIDWAGEFNSYVVPFAPFGAATVSRSLQPQLAEFLYALSESDGADFTRAADEGSDVARNGEPYGELGVVRQGDFAWRDQTGGPADPQPGNIGGGPRDVLRSASFSEASGAAALDNFAVDSGKWSVQSGALQVSAESTVSDAVAVYNVGAQLPGYFEMQASLKVLKPTAGWKANSYLVFDYLDDKDFKFAGIDVATNKLVIGHRDGSGWHVDKQTNLQVKPDQFYNAILAVNGVNATIVIDNNTSLTQTYAPRVVDGYSYGLNWGFVGVGTDKSRGAFDNIRVQTLPDQITFQNVEDFQDGQANLFIGNTGTWSVGGGRYSTQASGATAMSLLDLGVQQLSIDALLDLNAKVNTQGRAGFVFDRYDDGFKFVAVDVAADKVLIGHYTAKGGWVTDQAFAKTLNAGADYTLGVTLKGTTVSVTVNDQVVGGYAFNAVTVDGKFGLAAFAGEASFDDVKVKSTDRAFADAEPGSNMLASGPSLASDTGVETLTAAPLDAAAEVAISYWIDALGVGDERLGGLADVRFLVGDLEGSALGYSQGSTVVIDRDAAGYGWYVDLTGSTAFTVTGEADTRMDLVSVVTHELGHLLGMDHEDAGVMDAELELGVRLLDAVKFDADPDAPVSDAQLKSLAAKAIQFGFDLDTGGGGVSGRIDWQAERTGPSTWGGDFAAYTPEKSKAGAKNFSEYLVKGFDSLGAALLGKGKAKK
jgi:Ca2+-binding RTX toxin-like protein